MKGIYFDGKDALYREDLPMPVCRREESLVKIHLAAVCNTDKEVRRGYKPDFTGVMGHEFVGEVVSSPDAGWIGKRVVGELNAACGKCVYCRTGRPTHCSQRRVLGMTDKDGCFAEYMTIDTALLHEVPETLPDEVAVFTEPLAAALEILTQVHVSPDKNAAVLGDGRLALMTAQVLALTGVDLTVIGRHEEKLEAFRPFAKVTRQGEKEGYEYVVECTGSPTGLPTALELVRKKLLNVIRELADFAEKQKAQPTLAFTHFQPAQPTTVGKRASLWLQEFYMDLNDLDYVKDSLRLLGSKGTTGTQASFLELFEGDQEKVDKVDPMIAEKLGFSGCYPVSGQTYSRKVDTRVMNVLAGIAASAHKMSNDIRLLQHLKEVEEPFEKNQIGSSAMAYKRNPMRSERIASLARYVMVDALNPAITSATQWFERTLDDSANKRISIAEGFLAVDGILDLCLNVVDGLVVYPKVIEKRLRSELPFMATENIMMDAVKAGGDRQELHERIRELSMEAGRRVKEEGADNQLMSLIAQDEMFHLDEEALEASLEPSRYVGCSAHQVERFLDEVIRPVLKENEAVLGMKAEINV